MVVSTQRPNQKTFVVKHVRTEVSMSKQSRSRSMSPASGERQGGEGLLSSPAIQRALQARRATLALAQESTSTPAGGHSRLLFIPRTLKTANNRLGNGAPGCFVCLGGRLCRLMRTAVMSQGFSGVSERDPSWASAAGNNFLM